MSPTQIGWSRGLVVAIGLLVALLAYAQSSIGDAPEMSSRERTELEQANEASQAEAAISRTGIAAKLAAALGDEFGGVWFDAETAQLYVGVTSPQSRRNAEAVAAQEGMQENVTETSVESTQAELEATQDRWARILADLFELGEVATSLAPQRNALEVEVASSVPSARRAALEREARADGVEVLIDWVPARHLGGLPEARCKINAKYAACNAPIAAGQTIRATFIEAEVEHSDAEIAEEEGVKVVRCTAGPTAVKKDRSKPADATTTYLLTAGHCIDPKRGGGGKGTTWSAYKKDWKTSPIEDIGPAFEYLNDETDIGVIEITSPYWAINGSFVPVAPTVIPWDKDERDPIPVITQEKPVVGARTCLSGQFSKLGCGQIIKEKGELSFYTNTLVKKNLFEVKSVKHTEGDSGGPWFSEGAYLATPSTASVQGVHVGTNHDTNNPIFQSLEISLTKLEAEKKLSLELLKEENKKRHPLVKAGKYPATIHGSSSGVEKFTFEAGTVECKETSYHAVLSAASSTLTVTPDYKSCTASWGGSATVSMEGCSYVYHVREKTAADNYRARMDIDCAVVGNAIKIVVDNCTIELKEQSSLETVDLTDDTSASPKKDITVQPTVAGLAYTVAQDGCFCPFKGAGGKTDGAYTNTASVTLTGQSPTAPAEKINIEVADK